MALIESWLDTANDAGTPFPLNNLPYGIFSRHGTTRRCGTAIGDSVLDLTALESLHEITLTGGPFLQQGSWAALMAAGPVIWAELRDQITALLIAGSHCERIWPHLVPLRDATLHMPFQVAGFTDFYAGRHHAQNVGTMFRGPDNALPPNWLHMPIGYNGRAASVVLSGTDIRRPWGQLKSPQDDAPRFAPSARFDIELELGAIIGPASTPGRPVSTDRADQMIFGHVLLNDWSARDIQTWEYQPLGPFQAKSTASTISPWIVTAAALAPFRTTPPARQTPLLPYLTGAGDALLDIDLAVTLTPDGGPSTCISRTNARELYYSFAQQIAHHTSAGGAMATGDLIGSGTISGPDRGSRGSLLELSWGGAEPITLADGTPRSFLQDGDSITLTGAARGDGYTIGFGDCTGRVLPALADPFAD